MTLQIPEDATWSEALAIVRRALAEHHTRYATRAEASRKLGVSRRTLTAALHSPLSHRCADCGEAMDRRRKLALCPGCAMERAVEASERHRRGAA